MIVGHAARGEDGSPVPVLEPGEIHLWQFPTDLPADDVAQLRRIISADERERAERFRRPEHRAQFIVRRARRRQVLARYVSCNPRQIEYSENAFGKPALAHASDDQLQFNTSHSYGIGVIAVSAGCAVGVDVERQRMDVNVLEVAAHLFAEDEARMLAAADAEMSQQLFFTLWSCKEAWVKARGLGLSFPLDRCRVGVSADGSARLLADYEDPDEHQRWSLRLLDAGNRYAAALVAEGSITRLRTFDQTLLALQ